MLNLTKGITWRHSNIVLNLGKIKFTNTLKNNVQLGDEINGTKGTKHLQNNKTNIEHKAACLSQLTNRGRRRRSNRKNLFLATFAITLSTFRFFGVAVIKFCSYQIVLKGANFMPTNHGRLFPKNSFVFLIWRKKYLCLF